MFSAEKMRVQLKRIADIAAKYNCTVVIGHISKSNEEKNPYRKNGEWLWHLRDGADSLSWEIKNA